MNGDFITYGPEAAELPPEVTDVLPAQIASGKRTTVVKHKLKIHKTEYYAVPGSTKDEMCAFFRNKIAEREEWGRHDFSVRPYFEHVGDRTMSLDKGAAVDAARQSLESQTSYSREEVQSMGLGGWGIG